MHRARLERAALRVQTRWRCHKGQLAYHLRLQALKVDWPAMRAWSEQWDEDGQATYYYHAATEQTAWDPPHGWARYVEARAAWEAIGKRIRGGG